MISGICRRIAERLLMAMRAAQGLPSHQPVNAPVILAARMMVRRALVEQVAQFEQSKENSE